MTSFSPIAACILITSGAIWLATCYDVMAACILITSAAGWLATCYDVMAACILLTSAAGWLATCYDVMAACILITSAAIWGGYLLITNCIFISKEKWYALFKVDTDLDTRYHFQYILCCSYIYTIHQHWNTKHHCGNCFCFQYIHQYLWKKDTNGHEIMGWSKRHILKELLILFRR